MDNVPAAKGGRDEGRGKAGCNPARLLKDHMSHDIGAVDHALEIHLCTLSLVLKRQVLSELVGKALLAS